MDPEQLKFIIHATLAPRKLYPQGEVGFDVRFLCQQFGSDLANLYALWIRSSALARLLRYERLDAWITDSVDSPIVHDAVIKTGATFPLTGSCFDFQLFLQKVRTIEPSL